MAGSEIRQRLLNSGPERLFLLPLERHIAQRRPLEDAAAPALHYEPLLFENWVRSAADLADRILAYRREWRELDIQAIRAKLDHEKSAQLIDIDRDIQLRQLKIAASEAAIATQQQAAQRFADQGGVQAGFFELAVGRGREIDLELGDTHEQVRLVEARAQVLHTYDAELKTLREADGSALNFVERAERALELVVEDVSEACAKCAAIRMGIQQVHGYDLGKPPGDDGAPVVDALVHWVRKAIRWLEWVAQYEREIELIIPLCQPTKGGAPVQRADYVASFDAAKARRGAPVRIPFELGPSRFPGKGRPRLRSVGLSLGAIANWADDGFDRHAPHDAYIRATGRVQLPAQSGDAAGVGRVLGFAGISSFTGSRIEVRDALHMRNSDPRGEWVIEIDPDVVFADHKAATIFDSFDGGIPADVKLTLRVQWTELPVAGA